MIRSKNGFSLLEVIIAAMIAGVVASTAFTNYQLAVERMIAHEGEQILLALYAQYKRTEVESGTLITDSQLQAMVGVSKNFDTTSNLRVLLIPPVGPGERYSIIRVNSPTRYILSLTTLQSNPQPILACSAIVTRNSGICKKIGY